MTRPGHTILLVDGNNVSLRAMHGCAPLKDLSGIPTGCLMTTIRTLYKIANILNPVRTIIVWDGGHSKYRKLLHPDYKKRVYKEEEREEKELFLKDWKAQVKALQEYLPYLGVGQIQMMGCEADDLIFRLKEKVNSFYWDCVVVSSDADFFQLLGSHCWLYHLSREKLYSHEDLLEEYGVSVSQWVDYRAMIGDGSDNIDGVHGIGPKNASSILNTFGNLEQFYKTVEELEHANWLEVSGKKVHRTLYESKQLILRNQDLMDLSKLPVNEIDEKELQDKLELAIELTVDYPAFMKACAKHQLITIMEENNLWCKLWKR